MVSSHRYQAAGQVPKDPQRHISAPRARWEQDTELGSRSIYVLCTGLGDLIHIPRLNSGCKYAVHQHANGKQTALFYTFTVPKALYNAATFTHSYTTWQWPTGSILVFSFLPMDYLTCGQSSSESGLSPDRIRLVKSDFIYIAPVHINRHLILFLA